MSIKRHASARLLYSNVVSDEKSLCILYSDNIFHAFLHRCVPTRVAKSNADLANKSLGLDPVREFGRVCIAYGNIPSKFDHDIYSGNEPERRNKTVLVRSAHASKIFKVF